MANQKPILCPYCQQPFSNLAPIDVPKVDQSRQNGLRFVPTGFGLDTPLRDLRKAGANLTRTAAFQHETQQQRAKAAETAKFSDDSVMDNPLIGGRFVICTCLYGEYFELHERVLTGILSSVPKNRRQLRVATNEACQKTVDFVKNLSNTGEIYKLIINHENRKKYPAMRQLFHDQDDPIVDKWVVWLDDDVRIIDPRWWVRVAYDIVDYYKDGCRIFGNPYFIGISTAQQEWIKSRPWYRGRHFQLRNGHEAPNGSYVHFPRGAVWCLDMDVVREQNIPDPDIGNNGGDYMIMQQVWQAGYKLHGWNRGSKLIWDNEPRRGLDERHTGTIGWVPGGNPKGD